MIKTINRARRALYRRGIFKAKRLPVPVISVGNIAMGGAGKTPAVIAIARALTERGLRVGVLTRGYGRRGEGGVVDDLDPVRYGDEPVLIKKSVPDARVIVGINRYYNAIRNDCDVFILDDGFQHMQIARDLDIVIDAPARFYRESPEALRDADIVVPRALRISVPESIRNKRVFAFAGLASNQQFFDALAQNGLHVVGTRSFRDHHHYSRADLDSMKAVEADVLVTTQKDAVKIDDASIVAIPAEFAFPAGVMERIIAVATR